MGNVLTEPLLQAKGDEERQEEKVGVTKYAQAGFFSKVGFRWLHPFLRESARKPIRQDDIPLLAPQDEAAELYKRFIVQTLRNSAQSTADQILVDYMIPARIGGAITCIFQDLGILVVAGQIVWQIVVLAICLCIIFWRIQVYYFASSRELSRMDGITKAPIISHFSGTVAGFATIRCFQQQERFVKVNEDRVNSSLRMDFHTNGTAEWAGLRMELIAVLFMFGSAILLMFPPAGFIDPS